MKKENNIILYNDQNDEFDYTILKENILHFDKNASYDNIIVFASLGLWYGRRQAHKEFKTLYDAVTLCAEDENKLYFKRKNTTLMLDALHHDGCNVFKFYKVIKGKKYAIKLNEIEDY